MSTTLRGYDLNDVGEAPDWAPRERLLFETIISKLPGAGATLVTTEHEHRHNDMQDLDVGDYLHMTAIEHLALVGGGLNTLHHHSQLWDSGNASARLTVGAAGIVTLTNVVNAAIDTDKFLVLDAAGDIDFRTGAEVLSDIGGAPASHDLLSATHADSLVGSVVDGDVIIGNVTPKWSRLAISVPAANVRNVFGVDNGELRPSWKAALDATTPATIAVGGAGTPGTSLLFSHRDHNHPAPATWTATAHNVLDSTYHGDVLTGSITRGDILYGNSTPKIARLAKGTSGYLLGSDATDVKWDSLANWGVAAAAHGVTVGTIPKATAATTWGDSLITENATGIGFGTVPSYFLHALKSQDSATAIVVRNASNTSASKAFVEAGYSDTLGISMHTYSPSMAMDVVGGLTGTGMNLIFAQNTNGLLIDNYSNTPLYLATNSVVRLTITGAGLLGINCTPGDWDSTHTSVIDIGNKSSISQTATALHIAKNARYDDTDNRWEAIATGVASRLVLGTGSETFLLDVAASTTADDAITWKTVLSMGGSTEIRFNSGSVDIDFFMNTATRCAFGIDSEDSHAAFYGAAGQRAWWDTEANILFFNDNAAIGWGNTDTSPDFGISSNGTNVIMHGIDAAFPTTAGGAGAMRVYMVASTGVLMYG